ncbi:MAG TPA: ankyrin repeat domain-containing protein [Pyrinomonadaceae bacterium]|nr:ankyrin repeat domain-containing protein [Pyrinomonadaceae bacterium]
MSSQNTSLQQAVSSGDANAVRTMVAGGAEVNAPNSSGQTPIVLAIVTGQYHLLPFLLSVGANPFLRDNTGLSAFDWAERKGRSDLAQLLAKDSRSEYSAQDVARQEAKHKTTKPFADEAPRQAISPDEKSRRFVAGLKQRFEEMKTNRQATSDHFQSIEEELFSPRIPPASSRESAPRKEERREEERPDEKKADQTPSGPQSANVRSQTQNAGALASDSAQQPPTVHEPSAREERITTNINRDVLPPSSTKVALQNTSVQETETYKPVTRVTAPPIKKTTHSSSARKRCPKCGRIYNSELLGYCAYHEVALVDADAPVVTEPPPNKSHLLIVLVLIAATSGALAGFLLVDRLFPVPETVTTSPALPQGPVTQKGTPELNKPLAGKAISLPEAEVPANTVKEPTTVSVEIKIGRDGVVHAARSTASDEVLRDAVIAAARKATFSVDKLGRRRAEGTISYTFK